ncbi:MAG: 1-deoxy-D-xylulose-5-phosphate synthase [Kiritimatiellae bacterium]|nr:1-deoxy-D-xylulose-5-phosphate synthase [Kiritimatiellia bacterium]
MNKVLDRVFLPEHLHALSIAELETLAAELRNTIIETVSRTGGHLAANLGVVELTIALLKVFRPPRDKIVWDVGHQTYAYKLLTGRKDRFNTLRQYGGLSGFQKREESEYDAFGGGHSGTALSAALGMAVARDRRGGDEHVVAVLGDGALGCGISLEALNNAASTTERIIVILNDNEMAISASVGGMARYLGGLLSNPRYNRWKRSVENVASRLRMGLFRPVYYRIEEALKGLFLRSVMFEEMGLRYIGPVDGHNIRALLDALTVARDFRRRILVHVQTQKGKGYPFAEKLPEKWHGTPAFDIRSGLAIRKTEGKTYSDVFGATLCQLAAEDKRIVAITAAMKNGTGLEHFAARFPDRFFDVGISEEHAVVFAAGLASERLKPVVALYSTFSQRAIDCVINDVCLQGLGVVLCLDRAGIVGDDGPTHHGVFDIPLFRCIPGLIIMQPRNEPELADMLVSALALNRPVVIRYPRGCGPGDDVGVIRRKIEIGSAETLRDGEHIQIWALGDMVSLALGAANILETKGIKCGVVNARFVRPLDESLLLQQAARTRLFITLENGVVTGGFGSAVQETLASHGMNVPVLRFGWPDQFIPQGPCEKLMAEFGLTAEAVAAAICKRL